MYSPACGVPCRAPGSGYLPAMTITTPTWTAAELAEVRRHLIGTCEELRQRLAEHTAAAPVCGDIADQAERVATASFDELTFERDQLLLERTVHALERLDAGVYDRCEHCQVMIPKARLEALWYATACLDCAQSVQT